MVRLHPEAVSAVLKEGTLVTVKLDGSIYWHGNIIYKSEGNMIFAALVDKFLEDPIAPGRTLSVKYVNEYFIYTFEGTVIKVTAEYPGYVAVRVTSAEETINTRLSPRYDVNLFASLTPVWDTDAYPATVTDISFGGAAFISGTRFDHNEELEMDIMLNESQSVRVIGKIVNKILKGKMAEYSMQFTDTEISSYRTLSLYFGQLEENAAAMYIHFLANIKGKSSHFTC